MGHPWKSRGEKRTIVWNQEQPEEVTRYLVDMREAIRYALQVAYRDMARDSGRIPSPITLRREAKEWFNSRYSYARHHINPVCRAAIALLRSYRKNRYGEFRIPEVKKLAMRIDSELFKIVDGSIRITVQPNKYVWLPIKTSNKHYEEYSTGKASELLITDRKVCLTFIVSNGEKKPLGERLAASDLNFKTIDSTRVSLSNQPALVGVETQPIKEIVRIQNDFSRRRRMMQKHIKNPQKRAKKLMGTRGRQRNRVKDVLHKLSTEQVRRNPDTTFVFENLKGIRRNGETKSREFRTYLNRWPYRLYQSMVEYKSPNRTIYVSPRGTSSECPVCGGNLEHPAWAVSRCVKCGVDYDRDRLASLAILCRGLRLCGQPFAVSADASWQLLKDEYLHTPTTPEGGRAGWTEVANAPNGIVCESERSQKR
ncbi:MAG: transposase [Nitrososphaerales archaeon]|nr:transposase [Nitrososphaerales archaeon]